MAPEQAKGKLVDKRADIWAFGCVLYEMLTGRRAFDGEDVTDTLAAILKSDPDWTALPPMPPALALLLKRCLERDYRRRVGDMAAVRFVLDDLQTFAASAIGADEAAQRAAGKASAEHDREIEARVDYAIAQTRRQMRRRVVAPLLALVIIAGVVAAVALGRTLRKPARAAQRLPSRGSCCRCRAARC